MTRAHIIEAESLAFLAIAATIGIVFAYYTHNASKQPLSIPVLAPLTTPTPSPTMTPQPTVATFSQLSPDGTKKVDMTVTSETSGNKTYRFTVTDANGNNSQLIYSTTLPSNESMSIPYNTFSPDDKYIFLNHTINGTNEAWVFRADGSTISGQTEYDNATAIFKKKINPDIKQVTTGWASDTLLIILTYNQDGSEGTSYWFEVPSNAIIPLATKF